MTEPFGEREAKALHQRLELGWSRINEHGFEVSVPMKKHKPPKHAVPTWQELLARFAPPAPRPAPTPVAPVEPLGPEQSGARQ